MDKIFMKNWFNIIFNIILMDVFIVTVNLLVKYFINNKVFAIFDGMFFFVHVFSHRCVL